MDNHKRDIVSEINNKYFSLAKDEVNIMADLAECVKRFIIAETIEQILDIAKIGYDPNQKVDESIINSNKGRTHLVTISYTDKYNYSTLKNLHSMVMDGLLISLRTLFYSRENSCTAGSFIKTIAETPNLKKLNENHLRKVKSAYGLFGVEFLTKKDVKRGSVELGKRTVGLTDFDTNKSFVFLSETDDYYLINDKDSQKAQTLAKNFYYSYYFNKGKRITNLIDIKEYEKYYFHKDQWPNGKRYRIITRTENINGWNISNDLYRSMCETNFGNILDRLEDLSEIIDLYYRSCFTGNFKKMKISCDESGSLSKMVLDICDVFRIKKPDDFHNKVAKNIRKRIPKTIGVMMLS